MKSLTELKKRKLSDIVNPLLTKSNHASTEAAQSMIKEACEFGIGLDDFCRLAIDFDAEEASKKARAEGLDGYEMVKMSLNLPVNNDFKNQITLQQASDTFETYSGTRALFPYVLDDVIRFSTRMDNIQRVEDLVATSRTINGVEQVRVVGLDNDDDRKTFAVSEGGRIPVRTVRSKDVAVKMQKHGSGIENTYEYARRSRLDFMAPFAARVARELQLSKVAQCTGIMINGDGENPAATNYNQSTFDATTGISGTITYKGLLGFLTARAKLGVPVDTLAGDYDAYIQYLLLFNPAVSYQSTADALAGKGGPQLAGLQNIYAPVKFVIDTSVPAGKILGFTKSETIEELVEANSRIEESEKSIMNQTVVYVRSEVAGFSLIYGDTRATYTYTA